MSRFNKQAKATAKTYEGGEAYTKNAVSNFFEFMFGSLLGNDFYETSEEQQERLLNLVDEVANETSYEFVAKVCVFSRNEIGLRSVSQLIGAWLNDKPVEDKRKFYHALVHRPDDMGELFSAVDALGQKRSHALVKGCADYLETMDDYKFSKYKMKSATKQWNMYDIVNVCHPKSTKAIDDFINGRTPNADRWENVISNAGNEEERNAEWFRLLKEHKLGYLALLRNVRNIINAIENSRLKDDFSSSGALAELCGQLTDEKAIKKSLVFPYQIYSCYKNNGTTNLDITVALAKAFRISVNNMPNIEGKSLYVLDCSGSMDDKISPKSNISIKEASAVYCCSAYLKGEGDFLKFGNYCKQVKLSHLDNPFDIIEKMSANDGVGFGTDMSTVFKWLNECGKGHLNGRHYDNYFIFSDFQIMESGYYWYNRDTPSVKKMVNQRIVEEGSHWFSFDLGAYSTTPVNTNSSHVHELTSLSEKIFEFIPLLKADDTTIVKYIDENIKF